MPTNTDQLPKLYSMTSIGIATFFCSLLAGGYLLYANYKALGMRNLAYYTLATSVNEDRWDKVNDLCGRVVRSLNLLI